MKFLELKAFLLISYGKMIVGICEEAGWMNNKNDEKPWEKTFEEDRDEQGNYSRTANRRNAKNN